MLWVRVLLADDRISPDRSNGPDQEQTIKRRKRNMKRKLWIILALAALLAALCCGTALAGRIGNLNDDISWALSDTGVLTISGTGTMPNYTGSRTNLSPFQGNTSIASAVIEEGVANVGNFLFLNCKNLTSVMIRNPSASIGSSVFSGVSSAPTLHGWSPSTTETYAQGNGHEFISLGSLSGTCGENLTYTFAHATGVLTISGTGAMTNYNMSDNLSPFAHNAEIQTVNVEEGVTAIGSGAFLDCTSLTRVTFNNPDTIIDADAFTIVNENMTICGWTPSTAKDYADALSSIIHFESLGNLSGACGENATYDFDPVTGALTIGGTGRMQDYNLSGNVPWYSYRSLISSAVIETGVTTIGWYAFDNCTALTNITIPSGVTSVGQYSFYNCSSLESVNLPSGVSYLDAYSFDNCTSLTDIVIPKSVYNIREKAFFGCTALADVYYYGSVTEWNEVSVGDNNEPLTSAAIHCIISSGACGENLTYTFDSAAGELTVRGIGAMTNYTNSTPAPWDSYRSSILSVSIANGVASIGSYAFYGCTGLTDVTIPDSVTGIGTYAFAACTGLTSVTIPDSLTDIPFAAFVNCTGLSSVVIPDSVTNVSEYAFYGCTDLTSVIVPDSVTSIGGHAFYGCADLTSVTIVNPSCTIGDSNYDVFVNCHDALVILCWEGSTAETYARAAGVSFEFMDGADTSGTCGDGVSWKYSIATGALTITGTGAMTDYSSASSVPWHSYRSDILSATIANGVISIDNYAFADCTGLTGVTIANPDCIIGDSNHNVFSDCPASLVIHGWEGSTAETYALAAGFTFDGWAIAGSCGDNVTWIFDPTAGALTISGTGEMTDYTGLTPAPWFSFRSEILSATIANGVTFIGSSAFEDCAGITRVTIPNSVTGIGFFAFYGCTGLTGVTIPSSVTDIGYMAFYGCAGLTGVTIPNSVISIDSCVFQGCTNLTGVTIRNGVTSIDSSAFYGCTGLTSITIPNSVTSVSYGAFKKCCSLTDVIILNPNCSIGDSYNDVFDGCSTDLSIHGWLGSTAEAYARATGINFSCLAVPTPTFTLPAGLTFIDDEAFSGIAAEAVLIPAGVTAIEGNPFADSGVQYIYGTPGTAAENFANANSYIFLPATD